MSRYARGRARQEEIDAKKYEGRLSPNGGWCRCRASYGYADRLCCDCNRSVARWVKKTEKQRLERLARNEELRKKEELEKFEGNHGTGPGDPYDDPKIQVREKCPRSTLKKECTCEPPWLGWSHGPSATRSRREGTKCYKCQKERRPDDDDDEDSDSRTRR